MWTGSRTTVGEVQGLDGEGALYRELKLTLRGELLEKIVKQADEEDRTVEGQVLHLVKAGLKKTAPSALPGFKPGCRCPESPVPTYPWSDPPTVTWQRGHSGAASPYLG